MSGGEPLPFSQCETKKACAVQFEIWKAKEIKKEAVCCITEAKSFINGKPVRGGISDTRMGSTEKRVPCETCHMEHPWCPGHFGYLELAEPVFNIGVYNIAVQVLQCVCKQCGALLIDEKDIPADVLAMKGIFRLRGIVDLCKSKKKCNVRDIIQGGGNMNNVAEERDEDGAVIVKQKGCTAQQVAVTRPQGIYPTLVVIIVENEQRYKWFGEEVRAVLNKVTDADTRLMGFDPDKCHPRDLLITVLPVPPPQVRPTVAFGTAKSDNELSHKLISIIKENDRLRSEKAASAGRESINDIRILLQEHVATYFHNASTFYKPSKINKNQLKGISERLKAKAGRLRGNLMGKRVDFSARTVITGDPNIDVDEVGVPISVASTLTFPERVNSLNRRRLQSTIERVRYPSANFVWQAGSKFAKELDRLKDRSSLQLRVGDIVERHIQDGDVVLFNRQPTLHRMSMMGHRARILPFNTFRLNLSCTTPYNADFDGDEMNLHAPQSYLTKAELVEMMMVPKNFVSPNKSSPCMGIVQDSLLGCARITDKETFIDKYMMQNLAIWLDRWDLPVPAILQPYPLWTGKQAWSMILPEVTHEAWGKKHFPDEDDSLVIRRGELLMGLIKKSIVGVANRSLIHIIFNEKGSDEVAKFINGVQRLTSNYLYNASFSVGVQDTVADPATLSHVDEILAKTRSKVLQISAKANNGTLQRKAGMTLMQSFEKEVNNALNKFRESAAKFALSNVQRSNSFKRMIECGSKGSDLNICQIAVMVGQQNVNGQRIPFGFRRRTLPHFVQDDYGEMSRGMCTRGYLEGLRPEEFYFHTMGGREGLIDTAVKTADTGYLQRKLIKALEDSHAAYDGTVRNGKGEVLQFVYGEDGLDGQRIEADQVVDIIWEDNEGMHKVYGYEFKEDGSASEQLGGEYMDRQVKKLVRANEQNFEVLKAEYDQLIVDRDNLRQWLELDKNHRDKKHL